MEHKLYRLEQVFQNVFFRINFLKYNKYFTYLPLLSIFSFVKIILFFTFILILTLSHSYNSITLKFKVLIS